MVKIILLFKVLLLLFPDRDKQMLQCAFSVCTSNLVLVQQLISCHGTKSPCKVLDILVEHLRSGMGFAFDPSYSHFSAGILVSLGSLTSVSAQLLPLATLQAV